MEFLKGIIGTSKLSNVIERVAAVQMLPRNSSLLVDSKGPSVATQIHQRTTAKYNKELRSELFHMDGGKKHTTTNRLLSCNIKIYIKFLNLI